MDPSTPPPPQPPSAPQPTVIANQFQPPAAPGTPSAASSAPNATPSIPGEWPGPFGIYKHSKKAVQINLGNLVIAWLVLLIADVILRITLKAIGQVIEFPLSILFMTFIICMYLAGMHGQKLSFDEGLSKSLKLWFNMVILYVLVALSMMLSLVLLVIPFFFVFPRLVLANYFLIDKNMGPVEAYKASWHATKGNISKVYGIVGVNILIALLAITIIGIPFAIYFFIMYSAASAVLYATIERPLNALLHR